MSVRGKEIKEKVLFVFLSENIIYEFMFHWFYLLKIIIFPVDVCKSEREMETLENRWKNQMSRLINKPRILLLVFKLKISIFVCLTSCWVVTIPTPAPFSLHFPLPLRKVCGCVRALKFPEKVVKFLLMFCRFIWASGEMWRNNNGMSHHNVYSSNYLVVVC